MARQPRIDLGDYVYHVINRANGRMKIFHSELDYKDFEYLLNEIVETFEMRILAYVIMPNHWHMLLYPKKDGDMGKALQWLGTSHVRRHHTRQRTVGGGHVYQGRYKSFLVQEDHHLLTVLKYIERNPVRAKLARRPEDWKWGSAFRRIHGGAKQKSLLAESPVDLPRGHREWINDPEPSEELKDIRHSIEKNVPYGEVAPKR
ncbi:transposase [Candidatus Kaiserbacteria bacterium]|nr:transposase [Candidatus Kaiserbacteria bacterium]